MNNKQTLSFVLGAVVLAMVSFFVGRNFFQNPRISTLQKGESNIEKPQVNLEDERVVLDDLLRETNPYSVGESRSISLIERGYDARLQLSFIFEVNNIVDERNGLSYRVFRVGQGDFPPTYSAGRIFLQVTDLQLPGTPIAVYDTEINGVEPLGDLSLEANALQITCTDSNACTYSLRYRENTQLLDVTRIY